MKSTKTLGTTPILELAKQVREHLSAKGYSEKGLIRLQKIWNHFARYADNAPFTLEIGIAFLQKAYGIQWSEFPPPMKRHQRRSMSAIRYLRDYELTNEVSIHRAMKPAYVWPEPFADVSSKYIQELYVAGYSCDYIRGVTRVTYEFVSYLSDMGIIDFNDITTLQVMTYIRENYNHLSTITLKTYVGRIRRFIKFLYINELIKNDLSALIPPVRHFRLSQIPTTWQKEDIILLLSSIDRGTPEGKRDYAIFLIAISLGIRIGDILSLQFANIDWDNSIIQFSQAKTNQLLSLPMSNEIGWAVIDYIKNGRPKTENRTIFIRHCAPFQAFCINNNFHYQVRKYASLAGIDISQKSFYGFHSFRHTFASNLLENGVPLPTIAELLGHNGVSATPIYLKVNEEQLRLCALDPEIEVTVHD